MNREFFKGIIWPRQSDKHEPMDGPKGKVYRYAIVGMLITDEPIDGLNKNTALCGPAFGVSDMLSMVHRGWAPAHVMNSDASGVLVSLNDILPKDPDDA